METWKIVDEWKSGDDPVLIHYSKDDQKSELIASESYPRKITFQSDGFNYKLCCGDGNYNLIITSKLPMKRCIIYDFKTIDDIWDIPSVHLAGYLKSRMVSIAPQ